MFYAHNYDGKIHSLKDHLTSVANYCGTGMFYNIGMLHDFGKYRPNFQKYLFGTTVPPMDKTHSTAGALFLLHQFKNKADPTTIAIGMIAIACHHTGLVDNIGSRLSDKLAVKEHDESLNDESRNLPLQPMEPLTGDVAMNVRMTLSRLVDADWRDTASFYGNHATYTFSDLSMLSGKLDDVLTKFEPSTPIDHIRNKILQDCNDAASKPCGWFSLSVPTGGGKTLSGMSFALKHAIRHNKKRVIVVIPYTSIIDQSHAVYANIFGEMNVLAHHSSIAPSYEYRQKSQRWENPIIVTTSVQFLETLMANKTTKLRKLHNIRDSVIIIDESQMLPIHLLSATLKNLKALVADHGCSIVLSTATQTDYSRFDIHPTEIVSNPEILFSTMKRTNISVNFNLDIANAIISGGSSLTIVNTRKAALSLFNEVVQHTDCIYLSAYMCPIHRKQVIADIKSKLKQGQTVKIISTQLIEAGVDIDLPTVYREIAGVDSIIQAAGRCNRNGNNTVGEVVVFQQISEFAPPHIKFAIATTIKILNETSLNAFDVCDKFMSSVLTDANLDKLEIMKLFSDRPHLIQFAEIAKRYKIVDDIAHTILCPLDENFDMSDLQKCQQYSVSVYDKDLTNLKKMHMVVEVPELDDVWVLTDRRLYDPTLGVVVDAD